MYQWLYLTAYTDINFNYLEGPDILNSKPQYSKAVAAGLFTAGSLHFVHLAEARYVLQNRLPNFLTYPRFHNLMMDSINKNYGEMFNGAMGYVFIVPLLTMINFKLLGI